MACGRFREAIDAHSAAFELCHEIDDQYGMAGGMGLLGHALDTAHRYEEAARFYGTAVNLSTVRSATSGGRRQCWEGSAAPSGKSGRHGEAFAAYTAGLDLCREIGDRLGEAEALNRLGHASMAVRRTDEAVDTHKICRERGEGRLEAMALGSFGEALVKVCRLQEAVDAYTAAASRCRALGDRSGESRAMSGLRHAQEAVAASANGGDTPTPPR